MLDAAPMLLPRLERIALTCAVVLSRGVPYVVCLLASLASMVSAAGDADRSSARVLLVTGIDYPGHNWRETTPVLVEALTNDARLRVDVLEDPDRLDTTDLSPYRAVFLHFMNWEKPDPNDKAKENLRSFVERGGGMVMIHFACGAFRDWPEFRNLAGRMYDRTNTHDPRGPFTGEMAHTNHAITRSLSSFNVDDELYTCLAGEKPIDVLATARSKITQRDHPMAFAHSYGKGRVFQTPLGHDVKALRSGRTLELIRRGTLWAAGLENESGTNVNRAGIERTFQLPPGFSIQLIAAEPDILNPMSIAVDEQGALWVTEAHTYRWGTNGSPFQPPTNPIKRIELGRDGRGAKSIVALDGFSEPVIGLAARDGKIFATCLNELFVCDIAADGKLTNRTLLVRDAARPWNPFGMYRVHVGPDDKLWLCIADHPSSEPVTLSGSDGRRVRLAGQSGGLVRCNLDGSGLEVIVHGFRAPFAFDIDPWGHLWHISNGEGSPNIYAHVIPGVDYGYASRAASYAWLAGNEPLSPPVRDLGAGANTAALHYYSSMFPRDYWGNVLIANWGSHGENPSNREVLRFRRAKDDEDRAGRSDTELAAVGKFLTTTDPKFRPTGIALAPDGGLYVIDWHGRDDENDRTGRILKIIYDPGRRNDPGQSIEGFRLRMAVFKTEELVGRLGDSNHSIREEAERELVKRGENGIAPLAETVASAEAFNAAQAVWILSRIHTPAAARALANGLKHADGRVRAHALRQLRQAAGQTLSRENIGLLADGTTAPTALISPAELARITAPLVNDSDAEVCVEAALAQSPSAAVTEGLVRSLNARPDRRLVYQIGFQLSRHADAATIASLVKSANADVKLAALIAIDNARHEGVALLAGLKTSAPALLEQAPPAGFPEKLAWLHRHDPTNLETEWARLERGEVQLVSAPERVATLEALTATAPRTPPLRFLRSSMNDRDVRVQQAALRTVRLVARDRAEFCAPALRMAKSASSEALRFEAIWTLGALAEGGTRRDWLALLDDPSSAPAALRALRQRENSPEIGAALLARAAALQPQPELAEDFVLTLQALGISAEQCGNAGLTVAPRDKRSLAETILRRAPKASPALGRLSFHSPRLSCSKCHATRADEISFGPNLANIGAASQPEYLVESILEPSKVIKTGFETELIETVDERSFRGLVALHETNLVIRVSADERVALPTDQIRRRKVVPISSMPEGLEAACSAAELADLSLDGHGDRDGKTRVQMDAVNRSCT